MKQFHDWLHISHLVREEFDDSFVASHLAQPVYDLKKV
jgi:hypothetical protein